MSRTSRRRGDRWLYSALLVVVAGLAGAPAARAQDAGDIAGRVLDGSGAAVQDVAVTLAGPTLLQPRRTSSAANGTYRFPRVAGGVYSVTFEAAGYGTTVREGIAVEPGSHAVVDTRLEVPALKAVVTGPAVNHVVDPRATLQRAHYTQETLDLLPTSRDPWAILALTPGVDMRRVGGAGAPCWYCQGFVSRGHGATSAAWTLDGVEITDGAVGGHSPVNLPFDAFQETQVITDSAAPARTGSGIAITMLTRSGSDRAHGSARLLGTDERLQSENLDSALRAQGAGAGNPIQSVLDYGLDAGGPLRPGRAWIWGSYGRKITKAGVVNFYKNSPECAGMTTATASTFSLAALRRCLQTDLTTTWELSLKTQVQVGSKNRVTWFTSFAERVQPTSGGSPTRPVETTYRVHGAPGAYGARLWNTGPKSIWRAGDEHVFTDRWLADVQWAHVGNGSASDFQDEVLPGVQPRYEITTTAWSRSYRRAVSIRPVNSVDVTTDYFRPSWLGGEHVIKAGWRWRAGQSHDERHVGGNTVARVRNSVPAEATLWRDSQAAHRFDTQAAWVQDTYTRRGLTVDLGLRWDRQHDVALPSHVPAHPFQGQLASNGAAFDLLPAVSFGGADPGVVWNDISPRIGAAYDLAGDGRTVARASVGRYYRQATSAYWSKAVNPVSAASVRLPWHDVNGDGYVQAAEVDPTRILSFSGNYDPRNPGSLGTTGLVDPEARNESTDELVVGLEREVGPACGIGISYVWRRYTNFRWEDTVGLTSADYLPRTFTPPAASCPPGARCGTVAYWEPSFPIPSRHVATNRADADRRYHGVEITARKRMAHGWMLSGSLSLNDVREYYRSPNAYEDPTNIGNLNGEPWSDGADARWLVKLTGAYSLPWWRLRVSGVYQAREGHAFAAAIQTPTRANSAGIATVLLDPMGAVRLPAVQSLDVGASLPVGIGPLRLTATIDVFNLTNANTVLRRERIQNAATANQASLIVGPRVVRLGVRAAW